MKGLEVPINLIIIIVISLLVLISISYLFISGYTSSSSQVSLESAKSQGCQELINSGECGNIDKIYNIIIKDFDANKNGKLNELNLKDIKEGDNLAQLCYNYYNCPCFVGVSIPGEGSYLNPSKNDICYNCCNKQLCGCLV